MTEKLIATFKDYATFVFGGMLLSTVVFAFVSFNQAHPLIAAIAVALLGIPLALYFWRSRDFSVVREPDERSMIDRSEETSRLKAFERIHRAPNDAVHPDGGQRHLMVDLENVNASPNLSSEERQRLADLISELRDLIAHQDR